MIIHERMSLIVMIVFTLYLTIFSVALLSTNAQPINSTHTPILLIHGYGESSNIWNWWINWLEQDNFSYVYSANFTNDRCGSSEGHAVELENIVNGILDETDGEKVNIIAHSKGGLDAR